MKKLLSIILSICMLLSITAGLDFSALAAEHNVTNRAEWLSALTETFDMTVEEDNYPDNYFSDLSSDSEYYYDVLLAVEFGLVDIEAGGAVDPEGDVTREFASQTLNFCLGWELDKADDFSYSFADWESCAYPDDDQIAVDHNWLELDGNNNFNPDQKVTGSEINNMLDDAAQTIKGDEIDENYDSTYEYKDDVIEISADTAVDFNDNEVVIHSTNYNIKTNDTFVVYSNGVPVVYTAKNIVNNGNSLTVKTSDEVEEEAVEDIEMQEAIDVDIDDFIPAEGYEVESQSGAYSKSGSPKKAAPSIKLKFERELGDNKNVSFGVKISDIKLTAKISTSNKKATVKASYKIDYSLNGELEFFNLSNYLPDSFGTIPIAGIGFIEFKPEISVSGSINFGETFSIVAGFSVDSKGLHNLTSFKKEKFHMSCEAELTIGIKIEAGVRLLVLKAGIYGKVGVTGNAKAEYSSGLNGNHPNCLTLTVYLHLTLGAEVEVNFVFWKINKKIEWKIFKETNSPLRLYFHFENGVRVNKCTADNGKYVSPSNTKYGEVSNIGENGEYSYYDTKTGLNYNSDYDNTAEITGYTGNPVNLIIPSVINGHRITSIGWRAFRDCSSLTSITIPNSVTSIGDYAFAGCSSLTSITIPNSITSIGGGAFEDCSSLTSITIPNSVKSIGDYAFRGCSSLKSVTIGNSVTSIGEYVFWGCSSLTSITIPNSVTWIGDGAFSDCSSLTSITIPNSVTNIGNCAFIDCSSLTSITIPKGVTSIGYRAFYGCSGLTSITIPNSVTSIGFELFNNCSSLTSIKVESGNPNYDSRNNCNAIIISSTNTLAFGCKNTVIPNSVTSIDGWAFLNCSSLTSITIPNSVTDIRDYAFYGCTGLTSITIPNSVKSIGAQAFFCCSSLKSITIPNSVTSIGTGAFDGCSGLTSITIPNSVTSIGAGAFWLCSSLKYVVFGGSKEEWDNVSIESNNYILLNAFIHFNGIVPHSPGEPVKENYTSPTCTQKGGYDNVVYCSLCGDEISRETVEFDKLGHTPVTDPAVAPTCGEDGKTAGSHCSVCGMILEAQETVKATGDHTPRNPVKEPKTDSESNGQCSYYNVVYCSVCGQELSREEVVNSAHNPDLDGEYIRIKYSTCTEKGSYYLVVKCLDCGQELSRELKYSPLAAHTPVTDPAVAATCINDGKTVGSHCSVCGKIFKAQETVKATGVHNEVIDPAVPATYTSAGKTEGKHCSVCGAIIVAQQTIPKLNNSESAQTSGNSASAAVTVAPAKASKITAKKKSFTVQWSKANGVDGYQIQYSLKKNFKGAKTKWSKGNKLTVKKLKSKKTYYVRVRSYKKINGKNVYSAWSTKKVKVK